MRGNLQDEQAAMRARQLRKAYPEPKPKKVKFRKPTEEEERLFFIDDLERELRGLKPKRHPKRIRITAQGNIPLPRVKAHGNLWSELGMVNADLVPGSQTELSIRNWGLKIKTRSVENSCQDEQRAKQGPKSRL